MCCVGSRSSTGLASCMASADVAEQDAWWANPDSCRKTDTTDACCAPSDSSCRLLNGNTAVDQSGAVRVPLRSSTIAGGRRSQSDRSKVAKCWLCFKRSLQI